MPGRYVRETGQGRPSAKVAFEQRPEERKGARSALSVPDRRGNKEKLPEGGVFPACSRKGTEEASEAGGQGARKGSGN